MSLRNPIRDRAQTFAASFRRRGRLESSFDPGGLHHEDPYAQYATFREQDPIHVLPRIDGVVLTRHADCLEGLRDPRLGNDARGLRQIEAVKARLARSGSKPEEIDKPGMLGLDGPEHARLRGLVSRAFTPRAISALAPRIEGIVDELLDGVRSGVGFDLMRTLAHPLPAIVICEMLGVPKRDRERFRTWSSDMMEGGLFEDRERRRRANVASVALGQYFFDLVARRRCEPRDDILSTLIRVEEEDGDRLSERELISTCSLLLIAGHVTTSAMIGNGALALLRHPDQLARLHASPKLWPGAIEETLRYECAIHSLVRVASEPMRIGDAEIEKGQTALLVLAAANRDPAVFRDPDHFDVSRTPNEHLAFGRGQHFCLAASLARMEIRIALGALFSRFPRLVLAEENVAWARGGIRTPVALRVRSREAAR
jgi:cytochrome P450